MDIQAVPVQMKPIRVTKLRMHKVEAHCATLKQAPVGAHVKFGIKVKSHFAALAL
jgi:hypothetical protein